MNFLEVRIEKLAAMKVARFHALAPESDIVLDPYLLIEEPLGTRTTNA